jgi:hypothetical protein
MRENAECRSRLQASGEHVVELNDGVCAAVAIVDADGEAEGGREGVVRRCGPPLTRR